MKRRRLAKLCVFLLLGAAANAAVAWGLAAHFYPHTSSYCPRGKWSMASTPADAALWAAHATERWPKSSPPPVICTHVGCDLRKMRVAVTSSGPRAGAFVVQRMECGLPMRCVVIDWWKESALTSVGTQQREKNDGTMLFGRVFPKTVMWPGFAVNTLAYAAVLWCVIDGPFVLRRRRRIRRGLCANCAYPVGASPVCTECGKPVKAKNDATRSTGVRRA